MTDPVISGHTVFCDDIRFEAGGKLTLVGVYQAVMFIHGEFPFTLPKFGLSVRYVEKLGACSHKIILRVFMPGDADNAPSMEGELPVEEMRKSLKEASEVGNDKPPEYLHIASNIVFAPLVLPAPGVIRVRALCGDEVVKLGALVVRKAPSPPDGNASTT